MLTRLIEFVLGRRRVLVKENERALHLWRGRLQGILGPGEYWLASRRDSLEIERHALNRMVFASVYETALFDRLPEVAAAHLTVIRAGSAEIAVVERDGRIQLVVPPDTKVILWTAAGPWTHRLIDIAGSPLVEPSLARRLVLANATAQVTQVKVAEEQAGLVTIDGAIAHRLGPGVHLLWKPGRVIEHRLVDLRRQSLDVSGQELLTRDRVTIRINVTAEYQVADPELAVRSVKDFVDVLYRSLQHAFRSSLGAMTLDQILDRKGAVDAAAVDRIKTEMAAIGVTVFEITLKDVVLPGEMRDIVNKVVAAEKEAEANVIRRREETNATRSLLNTAKVMAENPVMLRLKELEALETLAGKIDRIVVHNGTDGLLNGLIRLRDD